MPQATTTDTDQCWAAFSCAGSWWWASLWRPCPGWSWRCGAGAAAGPARRTPPTPSHAGIAPRPSTSPSSAPSSPCGGQVVVDQTQPLIPLRTLQELTSWVWSATGLSLGRLQQLESATSELTAKLPSGPAWDSFTYTAICSRLIGCWPKATEYAPLKVIGCEAGAWILRSVSWCAAKIQWDTNHCDIYESGWADLRGGEW